MDTKPVDERLVLSALASSLVGLTVPYPFNVVRTLQQTGHKQGDPSIGTVARTIVRSGGLTALYRGYPASVCLYCPGQAIYYATYYALAPELERRQCGELTSDFAAGFAGMAVGTLLWCPVSGEMQPYRTHIHIYALLLLL